MSDIKILLEQLNNTPHEVEFDEVINVINNNYTYTATAFRNGTESDNVSNAAGENEGSCKIFSFAKHYKLSVEQTLNCFGKYYREDVLLHPENKDHANIRIFMKYGWEYILFSGIALT